MPTIVLTVKIACRSVQYASMAWRVSSSSIVGERSTSSRVMRVKIFNKIVEDLLWMRW